MKLKYEVKHCSPAESSGTWYENGSVKLIATKLTREQVLRLQKAINEALSN